ncbi:MULTISPECIES: M20 metallopeptidase family protein [Salimicrobium]|nr:MULTISPECIES: M20 family metallopeptidase [Salimicrobium]EKE31774.1 aminoacylase [Salimicrobium jeotgali]MBM7696264.1 amidohydrolase [Salimicrobium jeotgali]SDX36352.1 amidohydrolase [Salimicrobium album]SIS47555.1 amidohydrolase [Salimicrobium salexigens]
MYGPETLSDHMVEWRRHLHQHPELSFEEKETSAYIAEKLKKLECFEVHEQVGGYGIVAVISNGEGPVVGVRADMDALPITEQSSAGYASVNEGVMHACGHDAHCAILLGVAHWVKEHRETITGTIKLIFQPAEETADEEGETGAEKMIRSPLLEDIDAIYALHMCPWLRTGEIQVNDGPSMANNDEFHITIFGEGAHAGYPHQGADPIWMTTQFLQTVYSMTGRRMHPLEIGTISVGQIHAGTASNIIPDRVDIYGTMRSYTDQVRYQLEKELLEKINMIHSLGGQYQWKIQKGEPALINDEDLNEVVRKAAANFEIYNEPFGMGSEDFSHMVNRLKGTMFFLGCGLEKERMLHQPDFDIDEQALQKGLDIMVGILQSYWKNQEG